MRGRAFSRSTPQLWNSPTRYQKLWLSTPLQIKPQNTSVQTHLNPSKPTLCFPFLIFVTLFVILIVFVVYFCLYFAVKCTWVLRKAFLNKMCNCYYYYFWRLLSVVVNVMKGFTRVCDSIGAVCGALGVRRDHRSSSCHRLDCGGHWVDGEGGGGWSGGCVLYHRHLSGLLALCVWSHTLTVPWFRGWEKLHL